MNKHDAIHRIIDRVFTDQCESFKKKARDCLDLTTTMITNLFEDEQNAFKFVEALSSYFESSASEAEGPNESGSESVSEDDEPMVAVPIVMPKVANCPNEFNNFLSIEGKSKYSTAVLS
jgi:hypothetical protein